MKLSLHMLYSLPIQSYSASLFFQKFSSASKYAALLMDGDEGDDAGDIE